MNEFTPLLTTLLDLAHKLRTANIPLTIGGGFGLYLKQVQLQESGERTLFPALPAPRATNDIDLFLRVEVVASLSAMQQLAQVLNELGFQAVAYAKYLKWKRTFVAGGIQHEVMLDLLIGPLGEERHHLKIDKPPRVRPKGDVRLHAFLTEEAIAIDTQSLPLLIRGQLSDQTQFEAQVYIPQAFTYMMMKLFAFDDRKDDAAKDDGRHHAMDLFRIVAMMTESEYTQTLELARDYSNDIRVDRARSIVNTHFHEPTALGMLRLREHDLYRKELPTADFSSVLLEIFSTT